MKFCSPSRSGCRTTAFTNAFQTKNKRSGRFLSNGRSAWTKSPRGTSVLFARRVILERQHWRLAGSAGGASEEPCLAAWGVGGHVTPEWVLQSNFGCCIGTIQKSATYKICGAPERRAVPIRELVEKKEQRLKKKQSTGVRRRAFPSRPPAK